MRFDTKIEVEIRMKLENFLMGILKKMEYSDYLKFVDEKIFLITLFSYP